MKFSVNDFAKVTLSISALIFSMAALMYSSQPATASQSDKLYESGRYMMTMSTDNDRWREILVWDTQTGKSRAYSDNSGAKKLIPVNSSYQLPSSPLN